MADKEKSKTKKNKKASKYQEKLSIPMKFDEVMKRIVRVKLSKKSS